MKFLSLIRTFYLFLTLSILSSCGNKVPEGIYSSGVSKELAEYRFDLITDIEYDLFFDIPKARSSDVTGSVSIEFVLHRKNVVLLDFKSDFETPFTGEALVNGEPFHPEISDEHIIIPTSLLKKGKNRIVLNFIAPDQSLNRRDDMLYTLLVPDRARTLFPCFDQPDLKAKYRLLLRLPQEWSAVANGMAVSDRVADGFKEIGFALTEPIPTYLFSFAAGDMFSEKFEKEGRKITIFHRETDPYRVAQTKDIFDQIIYSLEWLEEYTAIPYPFSKYDIAIIPGFQYGGMEHTGATLYNTSRMFLNEGATLADSLSRASLIAHETAHMWFGDFVTMKWFNDVWTKEVFANWFAAQITSPMFPEIDHDINFINSYYPASYSEDRTLGATSIQQGLDNLNNAGLVYGQIIYNKAPIVMEMLVKKMGQSRFRDGIREYLNRFAYSNATWDDLIDILDSLSDEDIKTWSNVWIKERGMPHIGAFIFDGAVDYTQKDSFKRELNWDQILVSKIFELTDGREIIFPNSNGFGYGLFIINNAEELSELLLKGRFDDRERLNFVIQLFENCKGGYLSSENFVKITLKLLSKESNRIVFDRATGYLSQIINEIEDKEIVRRTEAELWSMISGSKNEEFRRYLFGCMRQIFISDKTVLSLYKIWDNPAQYRDVRLNERDLISMSYDMAIACPDRWEYIRDKQRSRIKSRDRLDEFDYIFPSTSPRAEVRDSVFAALMFAENREIEPWTLSALANLNHRFRQQDALKYIAPALGKLEEIQRTGDIFFPQNWCSSLLRGHYSGEASQIVRKFIDDNNDMNPMLMNKILQRSDHL